MNKKKYCSISNQILAGDISSDTLNYQTYVKLLEYFNEVHIYGRTYKKSSYINKDKSYPIYVHYVSVPKNFFLKYILTIIKLFFSILKDHKQENFSIFDASEPTTGGVVCCLLNVFVKKPFLLQVQGELTRISPKTNGIVMSIGSKYLTLFCCKFTSRIRVVSNIIKNQLIEDGVNDKLIEVLSPRVNLELFEYSKYINTNDKLKTEFNIDNDKKILLFVGRLVSFKGLKYLIAACEHLNQNDYHLLIVGDGELKSELKALRSKLGLENNITFVGKVDFIKVPYFMAGADFFVLPSLDEGFGRVILESMAVKTLVIASKVGGIQDIIIDKETGFFMEAANINDILNTIKKVLVMKKDKVDAIIEKSYKLVNDKYEFNNSMNNFIKLYDRTIVEYENS